MIILKIGGSLITKKDSEEPKVDFENLGRICREISGYNGKLVLIHGAGSYGHPIVKRTGIHEGIKNKQNLFDFSETQILQNELNSIVCRELLKNKIPAMPMQASFSAIMESKKLKYLDVEAIKNMVEMGVVPVLFGVPAYDSLQKCSILSGDQIITYLADKLNAKIMIHATDVDGVFDLDPKKNPNAKLIEEINDNSFLKFISGSSNTDVTGGMFGKVKELLESKISSIIINGNIEGRIKKALLYQNVTGTLIKK